jgi:hypothetical protein
LAPPWELPLVPEWVLSCLVQASVLVSALMMAVAMEPALVKRIDLQQRSYHPDQCGTHENSHWRQNFRPPPQTSKMLDFRSQNPEM